MLNSVAEGLIKKLCGKYLQDFTSENISISLTGTITLSNIQLRVEEFTLHQLPFSPKLLFIGSLYLDIPFITQFVGAGNFDIRLDDVLLVFSKNDNV